MSASKEVIKEELVKKQKYDAEQGIHVASEDIERLSPKLSRRSSSEATVVLGLQEQLSSDSAEERSSSKVQKVPSLSIDEEADEEAESSDTVVEDEIKSRQEALDRRQQLMSNQEQRLNAERQDTQQQVEGQKSRVFRSLRFSKPSKKNKKKDESSDEDSLEKCNKPKRRKIQTKEDGVLGVKGPASLLSGSMGDISPSHLIGLRGTPQAEESLSSRPPILLSSKAPRVHKAPQAPRSPSLSPFDAEDLSEVAEEMGLRNSPSLSPFSEHSPKSAEKRNRRSSSGKS